jgi:hypothetical protein
VLDDIAITAERPEPAPEPAAKTDQERYVELLRELRL